MLLQVNFKKKFSLYLELPEGALVKSVNNGGSVEGNMIHWEISDLKKGERSVCRAVILGLEKDDFDDCVLYQKGLNEKFVFGAEVLEE